MRSSLSVPTCVPATAAEFAFDPSQHAGMRVGVVIAGFCTFLPIYATQPLLPELQRLFSASALATSLTVSAVTMAIALASPSVGSMADSIGANGLSWRQFLDFPYLPAWLPRPRHLGSSSPGDLPRACSFQG